MINLNLMEFKIKDGLTGTEIYTEDGTTVIRQDERFVILDLNDVVCLEKLMPIIIEQLTQEQN